LIPYETLEKPALVQALAHPLRARMLYMLQDRQASPKELSEHFGIPLANVAYHVQVLRKLKLIKLVKKTPRRGAVEHHYRADSGAFISDSTWAETPGLLKDAAVGTLLSDIGTQTSTAAITGGFDRSDMHLTSRQPVLDQQAWEELSGMLMDVLDRSRELEKESAKRLRASDHQGEVRAGLVMMLFEAMPGVPNADELDKAGPAPADPQARKRARELSA
jgi:DNA-binding transcriptional ArsR family regulator